MEDYPRTLAELEARFSTEEACLDYLSHEHLDYYLDEFTFRFNQRTSKFRGKLFYRLVQQAVRVDPVPYKAMVKQVREHRRAHHKI